MYDLFDTFLTHGMTIVNITRKPRSSRYRKTHRI